jgi:hypothetical protein
MKKLIKLLMVLGVISLASNTFAEELGLKMSNLNLYKLPAAKDKSGSGGIEKKLVQFDVGFILGGHGPVAGRGFRNGGSLFGVSAFPGVMFNVDVAVHPYASVGGYFGVAGQPNVGVGIAVGARGVFHIYQLIADKAHTKVDPGDLDFYFPFHMGTIIGIPPSGSGGGAGAGFAVGGGLGVRYYFTPMIGIMTEVGWLEMSVWKLGLAMKF